MNEDKRLNALTLIAFALQEQGHLVGDIDLDLDYIVNACRRAIREASAWNRQEHAT